MDPLSFTASLIAVVEISAKLISYCCKYQNRVRHAAKDAEKIGNEITGLLGVVQRLLLICQDEEKSIRLTTLHVLVQPGRVPTGASEAEEKNEAEEWVGLCQELVVLAT